MLVLHQCYELLGVEPDADLDTVKQAYLNLLQQRRVDLSLSYSAEGQVKRQLQRRLQECEEAYKMILERRARDSAQLIGAPPGELPQPSNKQSSDAGSRSQVAAGRDDWDDEAASGPRQLAMIEAYEMLQGAGSEPAPDTTHVFTPSRGLRVFLFLLGLLLLRGIFAIVSSTLHDNHIDFQQPAPWSLVLPPGGGFQVQMAGLPQEKTASVATEDGTVQQHILTLQDDDEEYTIVYTDYPHSGSNATTIMPLDAMTDDLRNRYPASYESSRVTSGIYVGREVHCEDLKHRAALVLQMFIIGNRSYVLSYATGIGKVNQSNVRRFFNSFKIT